MKGECDFLRSPTRFKDHFKNFPHGCHWPHSVWNLLALVVFKLNDAMMDEAPVRYLPSISVSRYRQGKDRCVLTLTERGTRTQRKADKRIPITLGDKWLVLGDDQPVYLANAEGPMILVHALVNEIQQFWSAKRGATNNPSEN